MSTEKIFAVGCSLLLSPFFTYGCANYLMKTKITILPTVLLSAVGATTIFIAEVVK